MAKSNDVFSVLQPIYWLARLVGLAPYKIVREKKTTYVKYDKIYNFVWAIIHGVMLVKLFTIYKVDISKMSTQNALIRTIWLFFGTTHIVNLSINILADRIRKPRLIYLVNKLSKVENEIVTSGICMDYKKLRCLVPLFGLLNFVLAVSGIYGTIDIWIRHKSPSFNDFVMTTSFFFMIAIRAIFVGQFISLVRIFVSMLHSINIHLEKSFLQGSLNTCTGTSTLDMLCLFQIHTLLKLSKFHQTLAEMTKELNRIMSSRLVALFCCDFCIQTIQGFSTANNIFNNFNGFMLMFTLPDILSTFFKLIIIARSVHSYMNEVSN